MRLRNLPKVTRPRGVGLGPETRQFVSKACTVHSHGLPSRKCKTNIISHSNKQWGEFYK